MDMPPMHAYAQIMVCVMLWVGMPPYGGVCLQCPYSLLQSSLQIAKGGATVRFL
jgi:hypothetical protein